MDVVKTVATCFRYMLFEIDVFLDLTQRRQMWYSDSKYVSGKSHQGFYAALGTNDGKFLSTLSSNLLGGLSKERRLGDRS